MGVAVGDYDNDGRPDLYVTAFERNYLYRNTGSKFVEVAPRQALLDPDGPRAPPFSTMIAMVFWICSSPATSIGSSTIAAGAAMGRERRARTAIHGNSEGVSSAVTGISATGRLKMSRVRQVSDAKPAKGLGVKIEDLNRDRLARRCGGHRLCSAAAFSEPLWRAFRRSRPFRPELPMTRTGIPMRAWALMLPTWMGMFFQM